ncbi:hypothetical protein AGOR_G00189410 [Albula goreensis]|uniref:Uncharacterized protein n=1 Tax=Albula goreensis TaxID=1534307 RepID=A0A8T3CTQ3_9TELE|nr:hypothetical protein AGOR_G00189410 [Albula goreensis]
MAKSQSQRAKQTEVWVGTVCDVPLVGTSRDMVDGFIALLLGDRKTAEAKGFKDFLEGIHDLKPGSILKARKIQTVKRCSPSMSKDIDDYIIQAVQKPGAKAAVKSAQVARTAAELNRNLKASFEALRAILKARGKELDRDVAQTTRSNRGEHVFNNALLKFYGTIIDRFITDHVTGDNRVNLVSRMPADSAVSDAFQANAPTGVHVNLTAQHRRNIRTWVAHIPDNVVYIPVNNILFAYMTDNVRVNAVDYMNLYRQGRDNQNLVAHLGRSVEWMNTHRVYLDPDAAQQWMTEHPDLIPQFYPTEDAVQLMLRHLDPLGFTLLRTWVDEMRQAHVNFH